MELATHIVSFLLGNDIPLTVRLLNKAAAVHFSDPIKHCTVHLSQPVRHDAYTQHISNPDFIRGLSLKQRRRLLCLTAASGHIENLEVAVAVVGCLPTGEVFTSAAAAGQLQVCQRLQLWGCLKRDPYGTCRKALEVAAFGGHQTVCAWLLKHLQCWHETAVLAAARGGLADFAEWLLAQRPESSLEVNPYTLLEAAAEGCDLPTLQRLSSELLPDGDPDDADDAAARPWDRVIEAAADSPTPDWTEKAIWVEGRLRRRILWPLDHRLQLVVRLPWLRARGFQVHLSDWDLSRAAKHGNVAAFTALLDEGLKCSPHVAAAAAGKGRLEILKLLYDRQALLPDDCTAAMSAALRHGRLPVVEWLAEVFPQLKEATLPNAGIDAARSGDLRMLTWLYDNGWRPPPLPSRLDLEVSGAVAGGNQAVLEWLVSRFSALKVLRSPKWAASQQLNLATLHTLRAMGIPLYDSPFLTAARNGDLAMLRCLRRLKAAWGDGGGLFTEAVWEKCDEAVLRWLVAAGCPVVWSEAAQMARATRGGAVEVIEWLQEQEELAGQQREEEEPWFRRLLTPRQRRTAPQQLP